MLNGITIAIVVVALQSAGQLVPIGDFETTTQTPPPNASPAAPTTPPSEKPSQLLTALTAPSSSAGFWIRVTADELFVRSRADLNSTPLTIVHLDNVMRAVDRQPGFIRIEPPADCFSYIKASYVNRTSPTSGITTGDNVNVRVGNATRPTDPLKQERQLSLPLGARVEILGEESGGEWLKIRPPAGIYGYVAADFVEQISDQQAASLGAKLPAERRIEMAGGTVLDRVESGTSIPPRADSDSDLGTFGPEGETADSSLPSLTSPSDAAPATSAPGDRIAGTELVPMTDLVAGRVGTASSQPSAAGTGASRVIDSITDVGNARPSSDPNSRLDWIYKLSEAEKYIQGEANRPVMEAVWEVGIQKLEPIARQSSESDLSQIAKLRIEQLKQRISNQEFLRKADAAAAGPGSYTALQRTRETYRWSSAGPAPWGAPVVSTPAATSVYDARGILKIKPDRSTADQVGRARLIDPFTNVIIAYLEIGDMKIANMEHRWVGVRGSVTDEPGGIKAVQVRDIQALTNTDIGVQRPR